MIPVVTDRFPKSASDGHRAEPVEIWKARKFIEKHSAEELSLSKVAKAVNVSANHLSEKFKQVTGVNFVEYIAWTRFEKACDLLRNSICASVKLRLLWDSSRFRNSIVFSRSCPGIADAISHCEC